MSLNWIRALSIGHVNCSFLFPEKFFDTADQSMSSYEPVIKITRKMSDLPYV
jgi:hypothetical protein